ncbi:sarcosine oxidase subunit gamma family protein [Thalassospira sp. UBA4513]|uniref:sarcosine oxidase subunit gamma n=1 Tax=Thalassospira sp. UBA4513 TaxID=1947675 RepID=UPI00257CDAB8|nr:sarcosine oxidase subunit gamma family protein [Thalassospira sp. UBA4513]|tara:strand:+ start:1299 stop:1847 length:549 start_codon:yes stop_codon:yes gene_type:complete
MHEYPLENRFAFSPHVAAGAGASINLAPVTGGFVIHVLGDAKSEEAALKQALAKIAPELGADVRKSAPKQWFWVGDADVSSDRLAEIQAGLPSEFALADQTHGRLRMVLSGASSRIVLAKGTMVDLSPEMFAIGRSAMTQIGHIGAMITRTADDSFELIVLRSFASTLWDELQHMAAEFCHP